MPLHPLLQEAQTLFPRLQAWRRQIHQHPELGFRERRTAGLVAKVLREAGWQVTTGVAQTGVVGLLDGPGKSSRVIAIRADMDALPIQEENRTAYASQVPGVMHACGHDGNTTVALGAALLLARRRETLNGTVKLIFQPCEETPPSGAKAMIESGVLKKPAPGAVIAGHIDPKLPVGSLAVRSGAVMAAADAFTLTILGKGGHGAFPHRCVDAVAVAGHVIAGLQTLVSREMDPLDPAVLSIGQIEGGSAFNVIAGKVRMRGTLRSLDPRLRRSLPLKVQRIARGICRAMRAECVFEYEPGHPVLINDPEVTDLVRGAAGQILGKSKVRELARPAMTGEDFTYFASAVPSCFFHVGAGNAAKGFVHAWHHPRFDFDEQALVAGAAVMARTAVHYLESGVRG